MMILDLFNFESICVYAKEKERGSTRKVRRGHERTKRKKKINRGQKSNKIRNATSKF